MRNSPFKKTTDKFIEEAKALYGDYYDYSKVNYVNSNTKVEVICPKHGSFMTSPHDFLRGHACKECGKEKTGNARRLTQNEFIKRVKEIHGDEYDFSEAVYVNYATPVRVKCKKHGWFTITPNSLLSGCGCQQCGYKKTSESKKIDKDTFFKRCKEIHNNKYQYDKDSFNGLDKKIRIWCPEHGWFEQIANYHMKGHGCNKCATKLRIDAIKLTFDEFVDKSISIHGNKYKYKEETYSTTKERMSIICPEHGEFLQTPEKHMEGHGCPKCGIHISKAESEIYEYICNILGKENVIERDRTVIPPYEIDIYIPSKRVGIEYNGLIWHSDVFCKDKNKSLKKTEMCEANGIRLIQVFEDEYIFNKAIVLSKLKHLLGKQDESERIMGRKCNIRLIDKKIAKPFLNNNHIQGFVSATVYLGAYYHDELVAVMSFKKEKKDEMKWELVRYASKIGYIAQGIGGKLFKYFINKYDFSEIKSFADRRWSINSNNNLYNKLGFSFVGYTLPDYRYVGKDGTRKHKFGFRKEKLCKKYSIDTTKTENEITKELGFYRVYDCGLIKYIYKNINVLQ